MMKLIGGPGGGGRRGVIFHDFCVFISSRLRWRVAREGTGSEVTKGEL
jgi:hypothetical protein